MTSKVITHSCGHDRVYAIDGILRYGATLKEGAEDLLAGFVSHMSNRRCKDCDRLTDVRSEVKP